MLAHENSTVGTSGTTKEHYAGCSNSLSNKAAGKSKPEAYPRGDVEDFEEPRTTLADCFSILLGFVCGFGCEFERMNPPVLHRNI